MKKIFIYYSLSGNGDKVANYLQNKGYDILKILTKEMLPKNKFLRIIIGGFKAMINYQDKIEPFNNNLEDYSEIIIGSPIWNSRLSSPITTVLKKLDLKDKNIKFILYSGSGKSNKASSMLKRFYPNSEIINLKEPKDNIVEFNKI